MMLLTALPLLSMLTTALQPQRTVPRGLTWPTDPQWHNFVDAWNAADLRELLVSTAIIIVGVVPVSVLFATMAGYSLAQNRVPGGKLVAVLLLIGLTLPFEAVLTPLYFQMRDMGLLNSRLSLILPLIGLYMPFSVFWMRSHFLGVPREITEAAEIDGASSWQVFRRVQVPLAVPAWSSLAMLLLLWTSNQFMLAVVLINDPSKRTLAGALAAFQGQRSTNVVLLCAAALMIIAPMVLIFLFFQRHFVKALLQGVSK